MLPQIGSALPVSRRRVLAFLLAAWPALTVAPARRASSAPALAIERERIASIRRDAGLAPPLTMGMARVVLRPGASSWAATPGGLRVIAVEAGVLGVATEAPGAAPITPAELAVSAPLPEPREEVLVPAGTTITFDARGVASVRNPGPRPVVLLDAVVYPAEPRPIARAFTTTDGVSFQLLASANAEHAPPGRISVTLERLRVGAMAELPADLCVGVTLMYVEAGGLELDVRAGTIFAARAAASAPYAMPGSLQPFVTGEGRGMTAGGVIFLPAGSAAGLRNAGRRPAEVLVLAMRAEA